MAWNHVFWNMGKMSFPPETSALSHTIAFQAILAKKKKRKPGVQQGQYDDFLVCDKNIWSTFYGEGLTGPRILFFFRIPENYRTPRVASYSIGGNELHGRNQDGQIWCSKVFVVQIKGHFERKPILISYQSPEPVCCP